MTTSLFVEPLDVLLFRDGKPFSAGSDHVAHSIFPPLPLTLTGFVRSRLLLAAGLSPRDLAQGKWDKARELFGGLGSPNGYGEFQVSGFFLRKDGVDYAPLPKDVVKGKGSGHLQMISPAKEGIGGITSSFPNDDLHHLWARVGEPVENTEGYIALPDLFKQCLLGEVPQTILPENEFAVREPRTGIGIERQSRAAREGQLFTIEFLRLSDGAGFHLRFSGVRWPHPSGVDSLGGERRPVRWTRLANWSRPDTRAIEEKVEATGRFKLVLLTPAVFKAGWKPGSCFHRNLEEVGVKARLVGAAVGRPVPVGGFDLHLQTPKPIHCAAPAGSVYFFETIEGDASRLVSSWQMKCVSDRDWQAGMGLSVIGGWSYA